MRSALVLCFLICVVRSFVLSQPSRALTLLGIYMDDSSNQTYSQTTSDILDNFINRTVENWQENKAFSISLQFRTCVVSPSISNISQSLEKCGASNDTALINLLPTNDAMADHLARWTETHKIPLIEEFVENNRKIMYSSILSLDPSSEKLSEAIVTALKKLKWNYVQIITQGSPYFADVLHKFKSTSIFQNLCALTVFQINDNSTDNEITQVLKDLKLENETRAVLLLLDSSNTRKFFETKLQSTVSSSFHFLTVSSSFYANQETLGTLTIGKFSTKSHMDYKSTGFQYTGFRKLTGVLSKTLDALYDIMSTDNKCSSLNMTQPDLVTCFINVLKEKLSIEVTSLFNLRRNGTNVDWQQIWLINPNSVYVSVKSPTFYDSYGNTLDYVPVSTSEPFREECRNGLLYTTLVSGSADLYVLGVLPIHSKSRTPSGCGNLSPDNVMLSEAIAFGVKLINKDKTILPDKTLGYIVIDYCSVPDRVISQLDMILNSNFSGYDTSTIFPKLIAAVGFPDSENYMSLSNYLSSRNLLTISTTASNPDLSDKAHYPNFMRMVPPRSKEVHVILQLVRDIGVSYIGIAFTDTEDEESAVRSLMQHSEAFDITVSYILRINNKIVTDNQLMNDMVKTFISKNIDTVRTIVCFTKTSSTVALLRAVERMNITHVLWVGSDQWYSSFLPEELYEFKNVIDNAIVIGFRSHSLLAFINHTKQITNETTNPFIQELLLKRDDCETDSKWYHACSIGLHWVLEEIAEHSDATFIVDSVRAVAQAFDQISNKYCSGSGLCNKIKKPLMGYLADSIYNSPFLGISKNRVIFDSKYNGPIVYDIYQVRHRGFFEEFYYRKIGTFDITNLVLNKTAMRIPDFITTTGSCKLSPCPKLPSNLLDTTYAFIDGDPMVYAFVGIYRTQDGKTCSKDIHKEGYQEVESLLWSVQQINNDKAFLRNVKLGISIFDTCALQSRTEHLIQSILRPGFIWSSSEIIRNNITPLGIIGGTTSFGSIGMELGTRTVDQSIPVIISSSTLMPDDKPHPRLYRTVLSSYEEMVFILDLSLKFGWTYIHLVHLEIDNITVNYLERIAKVNGICLASRNILPFPYTMDQLENIMRHMVTFSGATAVFVMIPQQAQRDFFRAAYVTKTAGRLYFVFPGEMENFDKTIAGLESTAIGLLTVRQDLAVNQEFMKYLLNLDILNKHHSPWFPAFWEALHQCNLRYSSKYRKECTSGIRLNETSGIIPNTGTTLNINALFALVQAFSEYLKSCPDSSEVCTKKNLTEFYAKLDEHLDKVKVKPPGGSLFQFRQKNGTLALIIMNLQISPVGGVRLVNVGNYIQGKLTLDMKKTSFYKNGKRFIPESKCSGICKQCMNMAFVSAYDDRVLYLKNLGPIFKARFTDAAGVIGLILIVIGIVFVILASYYLQQNYSHKVFNLCVDANTGIIVGSLIMVISSIGFMFSQTEETCAIQIGLPGCAYSICLGSLIIKLNKSAALRDVVGKKQVLVPRWIFLFTYLPLLVVAYAVMCYAWITGKYVHMEWFVPDIHDISSVDDINIRWSCNFDRYNYAILMTPYWFLLLETLALSLYYFIRRSNQPEVKQVLHSSVASFILLLIPTLVVTIAQDIDAYRIVMILTTIFNGMLLIIINFVPPVVLLMEEEQKMHGFSEFMMKEKAAQIGALWRKNKRKQAIRMNTDKTKSIQDASKEEDENERKQVAGRWKRGMSATLEVNTESNI